jgi:hypothetical protein
MCENKNNVHVIPPQPIFVSKHSDIHVRLLYCFALQIKFEHRWRSGLLNELIAGYTTNYSCEVSAIRNHLVIQFVVKLHIEVTIKKSGH